MPTINTRCIQRSVSVTTGSLVEPIKIRGHVFKNRLWVSPMCMYSSKDGFTADFHYGHYERFAENSAGLVVLEASGVAPEGRISPKCLGIWKKDEHIEGLRRVVDGQHKHGAAAGIQLAHSGRKGSRIPPRLYGTRPTLRSQAGEGGWLDKVFGPSALAYSDKIQQEFADAAVRADKAGFDVVEIHGAHGYFFNQFLSPLSNQRTDRYGGPFENRIRILVETVRRVRSVWPAEKPLFVRVSTTEWTEGGWALGDTVALAKVLVSEGVDLLDCSTGGNSPSQQITASPGYQVPFATAVKQSVLGLPTSGVGLITEGRQANRILEEGKADIIFSGRQFLRTPGFVLDAARDLGVSIKQ
ncbi:FMN-linked oxidoreductase [Martensiomyces pterosporus]|nr:FMN-linked oxidoreductase [Martensiomyces pterosporus]